MSEAPKMVNVEAKTDHGKLSIWLGASDLDGIDVIEIQTEHDPEDALRVRLNDDLIYPAT